MQGLDLALGRFQFSIENVVERQDVDAERDAAFDRLTHRFAPRAMAHDAAPRRVAAPNARCRP